MNNLLGHGRALGIAAAVLIAALAACKERGPAWKQHVFVEQDSSRTAVEALLPRSLWDKITGVLSAAKAAGAEGGGGHEAKGEGEHGGGEHGGEHGGHEGAKPKEPLPSVFSPLKVYLIEKNHGILTRGNTEITYAAGGGDLDLHDFIQPKSGSFWLAVEFLPEMDGIDRKVFFLSNAPRRKIDGETFGAGCDTYFDISQGFEKAMKSDGFLLNTSGGRHISALAGTYFFAAAREGKLYLASLTIKDSSARKLLCRP